MGDDGSTLRSARCVVFTRRNFTRYVGVWVVLTLTRGPTSRPSPIGLYREIAIAIQKESGDSNGGNV